jgi:hypothetical protein
MPRSAQPEIPVRLKSYRLPVPEFAPVFHWLHDQAGLSNVEIASAFRIKAGRVRSIRARSATNTEVAPLPGALSREEGLLNAGPLIVVPSEELREELGISFEPDYVTVSRRRKEEIAAFEQNIEQEQARYAAEGRFEDGFSRMRRHISRLGQPHSAHLIRMLARLRHHSAWFLVHMGRTRSAIDQARRAMALSAVAFHESDSQIDCMRIAETGLVLSNAYLLRQHPTHSLKVLRMVRMIHQELGKGIGAEYYRQMGTAQLLLDEDAAAEKSFFSAALATRESGAPERTVLLWGSRQASILNRPNWAKAEEVFIASTDGVSKHELAYQMSVHWAVVTALATGEERIVEDAFNLFGDPPPTHLGHQATIRYLLELTPRLQLSGQVLSSWLRYLMYSNVFRDQ